MQNAREMHRPDRRLFLMNYLNRIEANGDLRGIISGQHRRQADHRRRAQQQSHGPVQPDGPAKGLLVDDEDQNQGKEKSKDDAGDVREKAQEAGFGQNQFAQLSGGRTKIAEQAKLAAAINDESDESSRDWKSTRLNSSHIPLSR